MLGEYVLLLMLHDEGHIKEDRVVLLLASKGGQFKDTKAADVNAIWECIKEKADDDRNPYHELLAAKEDGGWKKIVEILDVDWTLQKAEIASKIQDPLVEEPGEGSS